MHVAQPYASPETLVNCILCLPGLGEVLVEADPTKHEMSAYRSPWFAAFLSRPIFWIALRHMVFVLVSLMTGA